MLDARKARDSTEKCQRIVLKRLVNQGKHYLPLPEESYKKMGESFKSKKKEAGNVSPRSQATMGCWNL